MSRVDETRGSSRLEPQSYKRDVHVQSWVNSRSLAALVLWAESHGVYVRSLSAFVNEIVEILARHVVESEGAETVESTGEAFELIESRFRASVNPGGRGKKNALHNMILDDRIDEARYSRVSNTGADIEMLKIMKRDKLGPFSDPAVTIDNVLAGKFAAPADESDKVDVREFERREKEQLELEHAEMKAMLERRKVEKEQRESS